LRDQLTGDLTDRVNQAIKHRRDLKPADLMVIIGYISALWRQGVYTSAHALTKIQKLLEG